MRMARIVAALLGIGLFALGCAADATDDNDDRSEEVATSEDALGGYDSVQTRTRKHGCGTCGGSRSLIRTEKRACRTCNGVKTCGALVDHPTALRLLLTVVMADQNRCAVDGEWAPTHAPNG